LRTLAVYDRQTGVSDEFTRQLSDAVSRQGRAVVIAAKPNRARQRSELLKYGVDIDALHLDEGAPTSSEQRSRALDALLEKGTSGAWEHIAVVVARGADLIDRRAATLQSVSARQDIGEYREWCNFMTE